MIAAYYFVTLVLSIALFLAYLFIWHRHFDIHITLIFVLVPIANLGYTMVAHTKELEAALVATKFAYVGGCYVLLLLLLGVLSLCDIPIPRWLRMTLYSVSTAVYLLVLTIGYSPVYYEGVTLVEQDGVSMLIKQYGPAHTVFIAMEILYFVSTISVVAYCFVRKNQVSRKNLYLLLATEVVGMVCFFGGRLIVPGLELLPFAYDFALVVDLIIAYRLCLYDITDSAVDSLVENGVTGFASFDFKYNYLGSNETAKVFLPALANLTVDRPVALDRSVGDTIQNWLEQFADDQTVSEHLHEVGKQTFKVKVQYLFSGRRKRGYQLFITDDTAVRQHIKLLDSFNTELQREVDKKTASLVDMHDNLVMSMAMMVESRDNSTGGHIRRTSEGVRLLIDQMRKDGGWDLSENFCKNVIKAAPMHDLGKIAVDDAVLRKPGRFTPEEFEKMKAHAAEGARIVGEILKGTEDEEFRRVAENVAHYHHERWDGSGYPVGLKQDQIPLEARIMAIADVYDALVSKRVYKEAMSFERADAIIMDGMGSQFDQSLESVYVRARPHLERYYASA